MRGPYEQFSAQEHAIDVCVTEIFLGRKIVDASLGSWVGSQEGLICARKGAMT